MYKYEDIDPAQKSMEISRSKEYSCFRFLKRSLENDGWDIYIKQRGIVFSNNNFVGGGSSMTTLSDASTIAFSSSSMDNNSFHKLAKISKNRRIPRYKLVENDNVLSIYDQKNYKIILDIENYDNYRCEEVSKFVLKALNNMDIYY
jgi:hypothetical protein